MTRWITPIDITPGSGQGAWTDVDVSSLIPQLATGVILHFVNNEFNSNPVGWRMNGSTDNRTNSLFGSGDTASHFWCTGGVDGNNVLELYMSDITNSACWLVGYFTDDCVFFTNGVDESLADTATWTDVDVSGYTGGDTATGAHFEITTLSTYDWAVRMNGSTDARYQHTYTHCGGIVGCDGTEIFEFKQSSTNLGLFVLGYFKANATFIANATGISLETKDSWIDLTALPEGGTGGFIEVDTTAWITSRSYGFRVNGSAENIYKTCNGKHGFGFCEADDSRIIEGYIGDTDVDFYLVGYSTAPSVNFYVHHDVQTLTLTLQTPVIDIEGAISVTVEPSAETLTLAQPASTYAFDYKHAVSALALSLTQGTPTYAFDFKHAVSTLDLTLTNQTPSILAGMTISPTTLALTTTLQTPLENYDFVHTVTTQTLALTQQTPSILLDTTISPTALTLSLGLQNPSLAFGFTYTPNPIALTLTLNAPTIEQIVSTIVNMTATTKRTSFTGNTQNAVFIGNTKNSSFVSNTKSINLTAITKKASLIAKTKQ